MSILKGLKKLLMANSVLAIILFVFSYYFTTSTEFLALVSLIMILPVLALTKSIFDHLFAENDSIMPTMLVIGLSIATAASTDQLFSFYINGAPSSLAFTYEEYKFPFLFYHTSDTISIFSYFKTLLKPINSLLYFNLTALIFQEIKIKFQHSNWLNKF